MSFNPPQQEAVNHVAGPLLVLAGAGSGKTRVIIHRIARLMNENRVPASQILAVTFTNKAAKEMRERLEKLIGEGREMPLLSTFHSFCARVLREEITALEGFKKSFTIADTDDCERILVEIVRRRSLPPDEYKASKLGTAIDAFKNEGIFPQDVPDREDPYHYNLKRIYAEYQSELKKNNSVDFGDLIMFVLKIFNENPAILDKYHRRFSFFLVDEFQDTNEVQFDLLLLLASHSNNLCLVGDEDQSIYGWRGARIQNILSLDSIMPDIKTVRLEQNYRCTQNILAAANAVINQNTERLGKTLFTDNRAGQRIGIHCAEDERDEALFIARTIAKCKTTGENYSDHAVLYRANALSRNVEEALIRIAIPYVVVGGMRFFDRREIKDALAYLRLIANPDDSMALGRIINTPARGIGKITVDELGVNSGRMGVTMLEAARNPVFLKKAAYDKVKGFANMFDNMQKKISDMELGDLVRVVCNFSGMIKAYEKEGTEEAQSRIENLSELVSMASDFTASKKRSGEEATLIGFLERVALLSSVDTTTDGECVTLMTIHASKGLEFPTIHLIGMERGLFPSARAIGFSEKEEERRLCYVAITRAKERLHMSHAASRRTFGKVDDQREPSEFLGDLPAHTFHNIVF
jgi:DNA helicase-2/ATP-dependent DNA helicase PcrA